MSKTISIIIPFYCTSDSLFSRCMASIQSARNSDIEILIINDGSPEEYLASLNRFSNDPRVRIIHKQNGGVSSARNLGIQEAAGKWIMFVDSDDYVDTKGLEEIANQAQFLDDDIVIFKGGSDNEGVIKYNTTFLVPGINYADVQENKLAIMGSALSVGIFPRGYTQIFSLGAPYCKLLNSAFLRTNGLAFDPEVKFAEDTLFSLQAYQRAQTIRYLDIFLYYYVINMQSATRRFRPGLSDDMDLFFSKIATFLQDNNLKESLEREYYSRVQYEIIRAFTREFFHPDNPDRNAVKQYQEFIGKEPYCTAIKKNYLPCNTLKKKVRRFLVEHGHGTLFNTVYKVFCMLQK